MKSGFRRFWTMLFGLSMVLLVTACSGSGGSSGSGQPASTTGVPSTTDPPTTNPPTTNPPTTGVLVVSVKDALTAAELSGVAVNVASQGTTVATGTTNSAGELSLSVTGAGTGYDIRFTKTGYIPNDYRNVTVTPSINNFLAAVLLIDTNHSGPGNVDGTIVDAFTGQGISGLSIALRAGINVTAGGTVVSGTTSSGGAFSFSALPAGNYTAEVSGQGYATAFFTITSIGGVTTANQNYSLTPILQAGETRIVLSWGQSPSDLDSHLTGPDPNGGRFHTYYDSKTFSSGSTLVANLDLDDTTSYGPETTTIYSQSSGLYRFSVHDFSNKESTSSTALADSGAKVIVYRGSSIIATYNVPSGIGTLWTVFELNGDTLTPVNTMTNVSAPTAVPKLAPEAGFITATDAEWLRRLPAK